MERSKIDTGFVRETFSSSGAVRHYTRAVSDVGLWESERLLCEKYFTRQDRILDSGCGAGRTTIALHQLGYTLTEGVDVAPAMIAQARQMAALRGYTITWHTADVTRLPFPDSTYADVLFSFNGLEQIPGSINRLKALTEINRVLCPPGYLIFTTYDRELGTKWSKDFWKEEEARWRSGQQDPRLLEFGDLIARNDYGQEIYLHIPCHTEVCHSLKKAGFTLIEDVWRPTLCQENEAVQLFSPDCRLWVAQKTGE